MPDATRPHAVETEAGALPPLEPPYTLTGSMVISWVWWKRNPQIDALCRRLQVRPLGTRRGVLGTLLVATYDPPPDHPVAYRELVFTFLGLRRWRLVVIPWTLELDNTFFVDVGRAHYHFNKRCDPSLEVLRKDAHLRIRSKKTHGMYTFPSLLSQMLAQPLMVALNVGTFVFSRLFSVVGTLEPPLKTRIKMTPRPRLNLLKCTKRCRLSPESELARRGVFLWSQEIQHVTSTIGSPTFF